uniref:Reverse transcriptase domain-containing protein n=1 Tax=Anopheles funestus TaxID=62324 RepID=A0A182RV55_ANOFN
MSRFMLDEDPTVEWTSVWTGLLLDQDMFRIHLGLVYKEDVPVAATNFKAGTSLLVVSDHYISEQQQGTRSGAINSDQLAFTTRFILNKDYNVQTDVTYYITAAFDNIDHNILLAKISKLGCVKMVENWLESHLDKKKH